MQQQRRRSGFIIGLLSLGLLAGAALTARPAQAVDAAGPYYAEPAWDQKIAAAARFLVLTNWESQAVLDKETGLVWERGPVGTLPRIGIARGSTARPARPATAKAGGCPRCTSWRAWWTPPCLPQARPSSWAIRS